MKDRFSSLLESKVTLALTFVSTLIGCVSCDDISFGKSYYGPAPAYVHNPCLDLDKTEYEKLVECCGDLSIGKDDPYPHVEEALTPCQRNYCETKQCSNKENSHKN